MRPFTFAIAVVLAAACALQCSNSYDLEDALPSCAPKEVINLLAHGDEARLREYARDAGMMKAIDVFRIIDESYDFSSAERAERSERVLSGPLQRIADVIAAEYRLPYYAELCTAIALRPMEKRIYLRRLMRECFDLGAGDATPDAIATVQQHLKRFEEKDFPYGVEVATRCLIGMYANAGDGEKSRSYLLKTVELERRIGYTRMLVQSLGGVGAYYAAQGHIDSMHACWDEALQLATEYRMPDQAPRLLNFYARFYRKQGQTALAHDMLRESVAIADEYRAGYHRQRFIIELADFYKSLEHWTLASRLVDRAEVAVSSDICSTINPDQLLTLRAEILMGTERVEEASRIYQEVWDSFSGATHIGGRALLLQSWARGLINNGQPQRAVELIDQGMRFNTSARMSLWLLRAQATYDLGQLTECDGALDEFASLAALDVPTPHADWLTHDALRIDAALARGDSSNAWRHAAVGVDRLMAYLSLTDASVEGYLTVARASRFRSSLHQLVANDPVLGYGAVLFWIESYRFLGSHQAVDAAASGKHDPRTLVETMLRKAADRSRVSMAHLRGVHLAYSIVGDDVWRWTATQDGVTQDKIAIDAAGLRDLVSHACEELAPHARTRSASNRDEIDRLSTLLLPTLPAPGTCILVTPDSWLGAFPFEVLNVGRNQFTPLLANYDVAYLRPGPPSEIPPVVSPPLVFVSPEHQGELAHRFPFQPALRAASDEALAVKSALPGARLLTGERATREALLSSWKTSGLVYVIGHVLRDPEAPYMVMIPAAATLDARGNAYVEVADIRSMDLSRCGLVVLSGCSSGLPYAGQGASAPSLAQACVDAGARSVVHTFWDIDDREASKLMTDFINNRRNGMRPVRALAQAKRARMQSPGVDNFEWASYGILIDSAELVQAEK